MLLMHLFILWLILSLTKIHKEYFSYKSTVPGLKWDEKYLHSKKNVLSKNNKHFFVLVVLQFAAKFAFGFFLSLDKLRFYSHPL